MISIIMSVYNADKYLRSALESIYESTYQNFEVICINDGSTDNSELICKEFQKKYSNFRYFFQENHGLAYSRNVGVRMASGDYITFVDADDMIHKDMLRVMIAIMEKRNADVVYTQLYRFMNLKKYEMVYNKIHLRVCDSAEAIKYYLKDKRGNVCGGLFKKSLLQNIEFPEGLIYEDNVVKIYALSKANRIVFMNVPLYAYRRAYNSITTKKVTSNNLDILKIGYLQREIVKGDKSLYNEIRFLLYDMVADLFLKNLSMIDKNEFSTKKLSNMVPISYLVRLLLFSIVKHPLRFKEVLKKIL